MSIVESPRSWPETLARVPYWVYQDETNYRCELRRIFEGPVWNYVCLEAELASPGRFSHDVRRRDAGDRGARRRRPHQRVREPLRAPRRADRARRRGHGEALPVHLPRVELRPAGQPAQRRVREGLAGARRDAGRRSARTSTGRASCGRRRCNGLVFASCRTRRRRSRTTSARQVLARVRRVLRKPVRVLGRIVQVLPNNWKLYFENVKDTYHASLLHAFFGTFRLSRLTQAGGVLVSPDGAHHASTTIDRAEDRTSTAYRDQGIRTEQRGLPARGPEPLRRRGRVRRRHQAADPHGVPELRPAADPELASRCGRSCRRAWTRWSCTGRTSASRTTARTCTGAASSSPTSSARRATCRWRTAAWAASCSAGRPPRPTRCRSSTWAARGGVAGDARDRGVGARLLEGLPPATWATEMGGVGSLDDRRSSRCSPS